jgi:DDE family transposase
MSHQDRVRKVAECSHANDLHAALQWSLTKVSWVGVTLRTNCTWTAQSLVFAGLLWAWSDEKTLVERFQIARKIITFLFGKQHETAHSYQAFVKVLRKWTKPLLAALQPAFRLWMQEVLPDLWTVAGWLVFACDGSRVDVPRTRQNEARYSPQSKLSRAAQKRRRQTKRRRQSRDREEQKARERKANIPRIWLTVLWHVGSGLPWDWRTGPSDSSERAHLQAMLATLPPNSLITADAGFVGYDLWTTIRATGHHLLVRVGGNVRLLKKLGCVRERAGLVYLWPDAAAKKRLPPLVLRLVVGHAGSHPIYLVTSVMDRSELSDAQALQIYGRRWGIELFYRHCKQTFERRKLRSLNPDNALVELQWSLLAVWVLGLHSHHRLAQQGVAPERISFVGVLRAYRRPIREYRCRPSPGERLTELLDQAIIDTYQRNNKASRDYPRKKQEQATGPPIITQATRPQVELAQGIKDQQKRKRLTA